MSWNRTVRCSHCRITGHNQSGCPDRKAQYEHEKKTNPDSWWVKDYEAQQARRKKRTCSYCKEEKHTRRTCKHLKTDKAETASMNKEWRARTLEHLKNAGLGIGALVQLQTPNYFDVPDTEVVMISEVFWRDLTFQITRPRGGQVINRSTAACVVRPVADFSNVKCAYFPMDADGNMAPYSHASLEIYAAVLSPVSASSIEASVPEGWLAGDGPEIEAMFRCAERRWVDWLSEN